MPDGAAFRSRASQPKAKPKSSWVPTASSAAGHSIMAESKTGNTWLTEHHGSNIRIRISKGGAPEMAKCQNPWRWPLCFGLSGQLFRSLVRLSHAGADGDCARSRKLELQRRTQAA